MLREISVRDAAALLPSLSDPVVARHLAPSPGSIDGLQRFARWAHQKRRQGTLICFAIIPAGHTRPAGLVQLWPLDPGGTTAEWGIVIGREFWATGLFPAVASLLFAFASDSLGVVRLEARTTAANRRANAAFRKIGAIAEGTLKGRTMQGLAHATRILWSFPSGNIQTAPQRRPADSSL